MTGKIRFLSLLIALILCLSLLPFGAFADEAETAEPEAEVIVLEETNEESTEFAESEETPVEESTEAEMAAVEETAEESTEPEAVIIEEDSEESAETVAEATEDGTIVASGSCGDNLTWSLDDAGILTISGTGAMENHSKKEYPWYDYCDSISGIIINEGVTSIGNYAFYACDCISIDIPEGITSIGYNAFQNCYNLISIDIPEGVTSIGDHAFQNCYDLISVDIPEGITSIKSSTFENCNSLISIDIPESVINIGDDAFFSCSELTSIDIPEGVISIGTNAFGNCYSLVRMEIADSVSKIENRAFYDCHGLTSIKLGSGLKSIGGQAFYNCSSLMSIDIPDSVTNIGKNAFYDCSSLTSVKLGSGLKSIESGTFFHCSGLTSIEICEGVTSIGAEAFLGCSSLARIDIPESVISIGAEAFRDCGITAVTIPNGVTSIGEETFYRCDNLDSIFIPSTVRSIGSDAFDGCSNLQNIYYAGAKDEWETITIEAEGNDILSAAAVSYNCGAPVYVTLNYGYSSKTWTIFLPTNVDYKLPFPTRTGYTFQGWATSSDGPVAYKARESYTVKKTTTLYAVWKLKTFTVTYNANGGSGAPASGTKTYGKSFTISSTKPTRYGYEFQGWATSSTATTAKYLPGETYTRLSSYSLYAVWKAKTYTVTYNANGGSGAPASGTKTYGMSFTVSSTKPTRYGYEFLGWATGSTATTAKYLPGETYTSLSSFSLYAVWKAKTYTVTYNANGGSGAPSSGIKTYGKSYTISSTQPTRNGYKFLGWATSKTATTAKYKAGYSYSSLDSFTLYAVWAKKNTVTYNANGGTGAPSSGIKVTGQSYTIPATKPTRTGYTFLGWATSKTATTAKYLPGKTYTTLSSFTLYAVWQKK